MIENDLGMPSALDDERPYDNSKYKYAAQTQQDDDGEGYPRDWYSPRCPGVQRDLIFKRMQDFSGLVTTFISVAALLVIVWQGWIYVEQTRLMEKQWTEMRDTRELENRAWIGVKDVFLVQMATGGYSVNAKYVNAGDSPALCTIEIEGGIRESSPPDDYKYSMLTGQGGKSVMFPSTEETLQLAYMPGPPPVNLQNKHHAYYIFGDIKYTGIFNRQYTTKFCFRTQAISPLHKDNESVNVSFALCPTHNSFD
jgi:hypothetical protein